MGLELDAGSQTFGILIMGIAFNSWAIFPAQSCVHLLLMLLTLTGIAWTPFSWPRRVTSGSVHRLQWEVWFPVHSDALESQD